MKAEPYRKEIYCDECGCEIRNKEFDLGLEFTELERVPEHRRPQRVKHYYCKSCNDDLRELD